MPRARERGIALISVIAVLVLLAMVATPFMLTMTNSAARGEAHLFSRRADAEAESLFSVVRSELVGSIESIERRKLDATPQNTANSTQRPPSEATPSYDTPDEFAMSKAVLERFNRATAKEHRVWAAEIIDTQSLFNLNNCSYPILANLLGRAEVATATPSDKTSISLNTIPESFPKNDGVVRIGAECVKYKQIVGNDLVNCQRGYLGSTPGNGAAHDLEIGDTVIPESAYQIATRPYRLRAGAWVRYTNIDQARTISDMGVSALLPSDFERMRPFVTAWNGNAVGDGWCNPQLVHNAITSGNPNNLYAKLKNIRYFGPGTMVRITDGVNYDYAVVTKTDGNDRVTLAGDIRHDYTADQTRIYCLARSPINVNTADVSTLTLVFSGLRLKGKPGVVNEKQAAELAFFLKQWKPKPAPGEAAPPVPLPPGVFRNWEDLTTALENARDAGKVDGDGFKAVLLNAMDANDATLAFSTVPLVFRSYDIFEVRAVVSIQGAQGRELARREIRRVMEVSTTKSGTFVLETQDDFQNQIIKSRDAKYMATFPVNVAHYDKVNIPPSEYQAYANKNLFPSTDRTPGVGYVASAPGAFRYGVTDNRIDYFQHFDDERIPDGYDLSKPFSMSIDTPYEPQKGTIDLIDKTDIPSIGTDIELGLKEFSCSFWYRPEWERDKAEHVIFDYGFDNDHMNRVSLRYDPKRDALVLAVAEAKREQHDCEVVYPFDHGTWIAKEWYHIGVHVHGAAPGMMELFVDGDQQGHSSVSTRLKGNISPLITGTGEMEVAVEDAKDFPDTGVLLVRGKQGIELMEYSTRSDTSFLVKRRKARSMDYQTQDNTPRAHFTDDVVELYGFTGPLLCDVKQGGATLDNAIGPWRPYRFTMDANNIDLITYGFGANTTPLLVYGMAHPSAQKSIVATLQDWDTGDTSSGMFTGLGPSGTEGVAMIVSPLRTLTASSATITPPLHNGANGDKHSMTQLGGIEFVGYTVGSTPGQVTITKRDLQLRHATTITPSDGPRFMPTYGYGDVSGPYGNQSLGNGGGGDLTNNGPCTAFIPIAVVASNGANAQYIDPLDENTQLPYTNSGTVQNLRLRKAYVQFEGEWAAYDVFDKNNSGGLVTGGKVAFYRDGTIPDVAAISSSSGTQIFPFFNSLDPIAFSFNYAGGQPSTGNPGGSGGNSSNSPPVIAQDYNDPATAPPAPAVGSGTGQLPAPPVRNDEIAAKLDFRGYRDQSHEYRVANTVPNTHTTGVPIIPAFYVVPGNCLEPQSGGSAANLGPRFAYPGFNDLVTLRDTRGNDEQIRIQWGYMGWCAATQFTTQTWTWDRPNGPDGNTALKRWDSRAWTRAIKFPSGEMPDSALTKAKLDFTFGKKYDGQGAPSNATVDEIEFWKFKRPAKDRPDYAFLGSVPDAVVTTPQVGGATSNTPVPLPVFEGIDSKADEFTVHMQILDSLVLNRRGLPISGNTYADDGGVILVDDELIMYEDFDVASGKFTGCLRGAFGTQPKPHQYEAFVVPIYTFPASKLTAAIDESSGEYELQDTTDFPDNGYLRFGNNNEIVGYTNWAAKHLSGPLGRIDPAATPTKGAKSDKRTAGAIFRGRYGTVPATAAIGDVAIAMPFRVYDRYAEHADDPEQSYLQLSWTKHGAVWKRIAWDAEPKPNIQVVALLRFSGGPPWDSDKIINVGQDVMPVDDRRQYLYMYSDGTAENLINVEAERVEVRLGIRYAKGAYDRVADATSGIMPDNWKETPTIRKVTVEYVSPPQVLTQE